MGRASIQKPERLAEKLLAIRNRFDLSQNGLIRWLDLDDELTQAEISAFERGVRVPPLLVLLRYARKSEINVEVLIDDAGLELQDYIKYQRITDSIGIHFFEDGEYNSNFVGGTVEVNEAEFVVTFVINAILQIESLVGNISKPFDD